MKARTFLPMLFAAVAFATASFATPASAADGCLFNCARDVRTCVKSARMAAATCRLDCQANSAPEDLDACLAGCVSTFRDDRKACLATFPDCAATCEVPPVDPGTAACAQDCGHVLGTCAQGVIATAKACVSTCPGSATPLQCIGACAQAARQDGATCGSDFQGCLAGCGLTPPAP